MAAGKGSRIADITNGSPKSYLTLGGIRLLDHQINTLQQYGVADIVLMTGYRGDTVKQNYADKGLTILRNPFYERTNVLGSLWFAREYLLDGFYFMHADTYFDPTIFDDLMTAEGEIVLAVEKKKTVPEDMKYRTDGDANIIEINKEMACESAEGEFIGLAKINKTRAPGVVEKIIYNIETMENLDAFFEVVLQQIMNDGIKVKSVEVGNRLAIEIDFAEDYHAAQARYDANMAKD